MDEEQLQDDLQEFRGRSFLQQRLRTFLPLYLLWAFSLLLLLILFSISLSRVSALSSRLSEIQKEQNQTLPSRDLLLFPCGADARQWEYFSGKCYYFSLGRSSWHKAKAECQELHSQLAVIDSLAEQTFLMFRARNERFWIGLSDENSEGQWQWIDGTDPSTTFSYWKEGEPNDSGSNEDCAHLWLAGQWNDVYCSYQCYYICEKPLPR